MPQVTFTRNIQRHVSCPACQVDGTTIGEVLEAAFSANQMARGYVLDDRGALRNHMVVFINGTAIRDRVSLTDAVPADAEVYVMQALSGG